MNSPPDVSTSPGISIIIPTLDESPAIAATLAAARAERPLEVLVVDGGSSDGTAAAAAGADQVLVETGGLAAQLDRGARAARGEVLLFLHADTRLPGGAGAAIGAALADAAVAGGAFRLGFDSPRRRYRVVAFFGNLRNRLGFGPFGDQAIFARRGAYLECGGFRAGRFLPDLDLVRRLRRRGRFIVLSEAVRTSARRWEERGFLRTLLLHWRMSAAYLLGRRRDR